MIETRDLIRMVARQRVVALTTLLAVIAATAGFLATQKTVYQSTATVQLASADPSFLGEVNSLTPLYSALVSADQTLRIARSEVAPQPLADIVVRIFTDSPVIKIDASGASRDNAQRSAAAAVDAASKRLVGSKLGAPGVTLALVDGPSPAEVTWPRWALSLGVAAVVGLLLGIALACLADVRRRSRTPVAAAPEAIPAVEAAPVAFPAVEAPPVPIPAVESAPVVITAVAATPVAVPAVDVAPAAIQAVAPRPKATRRPARGSEVPTFDSWQKSQERKSRRAKR